MVIVCVSFGATMHLIVRLKCLFEIVPIILLLLFIVWWAQLSCIVLIKGAWLLNHHVGFIFAAGWIFLIWIVTWSLFHIIIFSSPAASLSFLLLRWLLLWWFLNSCRRLDWILRGSLWFRYFCIIKRLWLNILYYIVLLMLRQVSNLFWVLVYWFFLFLLQADGIS